MPNLVSLADRTTDEQRKIARMGGVASGKARREKRDLKQALSVLLDENVTIDGVDLVGVDALALAVFKKAIRGDVRAFAEIRDSLYGKPQIVAQIDPVIPQETYDRVRRILECDD